MTVVQFSAYYAFLRFCLMMRLVDASLPVDVAWRWNYWHRCVNPSRIRIEAVKDENV